MEETRTASRILDILSQHVDDLRARGVIELGLFGSTLDDENQRANDIDLLVTLSDNSFSTYCAVLFYLEDLLDQPIDLVPKEDLKERIREHVLSEVRYVTGLSVQLY